MMLLPCCMLVQKQLNLKLNLKENLIKIKKPKGEVNIEKEIKTTRGEMSMLSEIERNRDPKTRKARKFISYKKVYGHKCH